MTDERLYALRNSVIQSNGNKSDVQYYAVCRYPNVACKSQNSDIENWMKYEMNGYPKDVEVPEYRIINASIIGTVKTYTMIISNYDIYKSRPKIKNQFKCYSKVFFFTYLAEPF